MRDKFPKGNKRIPGSIGLPILIPLLQKLIPLNTIFSIIMTSPEI